MFEPAAKADINTILRDMAETRLKTGTAGKAGNYSLGEDALNLLHRLSSNSDSAGDALKLLHELQVHQIEIDLQNELIRDDEHRLVNELAYYRELYENAPAGYLVVDFEGKVLKANRAGASLFNVTQDELGDVDMNHFLSADSHPIIASMLKGLRQGDSGQSAEVFTMGADNSSQHLRIMANLSPDGRYALLVCCEIS